MNKNITPHNKEFKPHGYWERYHDNGKLWYKGNYANGKKHGLWENYYSNGKLDYKGYWDDGLRVGYWEDYWFSTEEIMIYI